MTAARSSPGRTERVRQDRSSLLDYSASEISGYSVDMRFEATRRHET